jgi:hypothetical protein
VRYSFGVFLGGKQGLRRAFSSDDHIASMLIKRVNQSDESSKKIGYKRD